MPPLGVMGPRFGAPQNPWRGAMEPAGLSRYQHQRVRRRGCRKPVYFMTTSRKERTSRSSDQTGPWGRCGAALQPQPPTQGPVPKSPSPPPASPSQCQHLPPSPRYAGCFHRNVWMESLGAVASMEPTRGSEIPKDTSAGELRGWRGSEGAAAAGSRGAGLSRSPVQDHQDDGTVGAQESRVLQVAPAALLGDAEPHALRALGDELAVGKGIVTPVPAW